MLHNFNMNMNLSVLNWAKVCSENVYSLREASHPGMTFPHSDAVILEKSDPCTCRCHWTVNIQTRENSHAALIKWKNQPACFCFALYLHHVLLTFFYFPKRTLIFSDRKQIRVDLIFCSSRCLPQVTLNAYLPPWHNVIISIHLNDEEKWFL